MGAPDGFITFVAGTGFPYVAVKPAVNFHGKESKGRRF